MISLHSVVGPSTALLRQFLPRHSNLLALARPFSQLSQLTINNGLRLLRSGNGFTKSTEVGVGAVSAVKQLEQVRGMKTRSSVKRLCEGCKVRAAFLFSTTEIGYRSLRVWKVWLTMALDYSLCGERTGFTLFGEFLSI